MRPFVVAAERAVERAFVGEVSPVTAPSLCQTFSALALESGTVWLAVAGRKRAVSATEREKEKLPDGN